MLLALLLMAVLFATGLSAAAWYKSRSMHAFCDDVSGTDTPEMVVARAVDQGLPVFDNIDRNGFVVVLNQRAFMFRYSCEIEFSDGQVVGKHVRSAD